MAISELDAADRDLSVSVSVSRKGQPPLRFQQSASARSQRGSSLQPRHSQAAATSAVSSRGVLLSSLFGRGPWALCGQLVACGLLVTLLLALVTIPLLVLRLDPAKGGTDMQRHHLSDEQQGTVHAVRLAAPLQPDPAPQPAASHQPYPADGAAPALPPAANAPFPPQRAEAADDVALRSKKPAEWMEPPQPAAQRRREVGAEAAEALELRAADPSLTVESFRAPRLEPEQPLLLPPAAAIAANVTLFTVFSPTWQHLPSVLPLRSWSLLFVNSSVSVLVYAPDELSCELLQLQHRLPVRCVSAPLCFHDRTRTRRRKVNRGQLLWEWDRDSRREARMICLLRDAEQRAGTPLLLYADHELLLTADILLALQAVLHERIQLPVEQPLTAEHWQRLKQSPVLLIGRSWEVSTADAPQLAWNDSSLLRQHRSALHDWLSATRAASLLSHSRYLSRFPLASDAEFYRLHNAHSLHWFLYSRGSLPFHAVSSSAYASEDDDSGQHGWESFIVWSCRSKSRPALQLVDLSDAAHVLLSRQQAAHNHSAHATPPSLLLVPANASSEDIARLSNAPAVPPNPVAVPLSPAQADYRLHCSERSSTTGCTLLRNTDAELDQQLEANANAARQLVLLLVTQAYLPMAYAWLCRAAELQLRSFLFIAEDRVSYFALLSRGVPVVLVPYARTVRPPAFPGTASGWRYEESLLHRSEALLQAHAHHNLSVLLLHLDVVLFADPLPLLQDNPHRCDVLVPLVNGSVPSGGLFYFPQSPLGRRLVRELRACQADDVLFAHLHRQTRFSFSDDSSGDCLSQLTARLTRRQRLRRCSFDPQLFTTELEFFHHQQSQRSAVWPLAVHLDRQRSVEDKTRAMKEWQLWRWDDEADADEPACLQPEQDERLMRPRALRALQQRKARGDMDPSLPFVQCRPRPGVFTAADAQLPAASLSGASLHIHLLADGDGFLLNETLDSLQALQPAAQWDATLHLDISPPAEAATAASFPFDPAPLVSSLRQRRWQLGEVHVRTFPTPLRVDGSWLRSWPEVEAAGSSRGNEAAKLQLALVLTAGQLVSPHALLFLSSLLSSLSLHREAQLLSICLLHLPVIAAETARHRFASRTTSGLLDRSHSVFRYQLSSLSGSLFLLPTLLRFLSWQSERADSAPTPLPSTYPCVPSLLSNAEYLSRPESSFSQWLQRFAFESALYSLHTQLLEDEAGGLRVLLMEHPSRAPATSPPRLLLPAPLPASFFSSLPPAGQLALFDFHFSPVLVDYSALAERAVMFAPHNPLDRTLGTGADEETAEQEVQRQLVQQEVEEEEDEPEVLLNATGGAGIGAEERVRRVVRRSLNATEQLRLNRFLRLLAEAEQRSRKQAVPERNNPQRLLYPGSLQDRCFVVGSVADVRPEAEDAELRVRPFIPPASHPAYLPLAAYHQHLVTVNGALLAALPSAGNRSGAALPSILVYQPRLLDRQGQPVRVPLDRQLRGLYFAFLLSLCLQRWLVVDMEDFHPLFASPVAGDRWQWTEVEPAVRGLPSAALNASHASLLRTADLQSRFSAPLLFYRELTAHDPALLSNPFYRWMPLALFGSHSRVERTGAVMRHLLSAPRPVLLQQSAALLDVLQLRPSAQQRVFAVRLDFPDDAPLATAETPLPSVSPLYLSCVSAFVSSLSLQRNATRIFFSTNRPSKPSYEAVQRLLSPLGLVTTFADNLRRLRGRLIALLQARGELPAASGNDSSAAAALLLPAERLIGFVLGARSLHTLVTDTTFGVFQTARNGYRRDGGAAARAGAGSNFIVVDRHSHTAASPTSAAGEEDEEYCGPVRRLDRPRRMDVVY